MELSSSNHADEETPGENMNLSLLVLTQFLYRVPPPKKPGQEVDHPLPWGGSSKEAPEVTD